MKMLTGAAGKNREALEQAGKVSSRALDSKLGDKCRAADKRAAFPLTLCRGFFTPKLWLVSPKMMWSPNAICCYTLRVQK